MLKIKKREEAKEWKYCLRIAGQNIQVISLLARILAEAATIFHEKNAILTESYGPEARTAWSKADVIVSNDYIDSPVVEKVDCLLAFTQEAVNHYTKGVKEKGILITDSSIIKVPEGDFKHYSFDFRAIAKEKLGSETVYNMVAMGVLSALIRFLPSESVTEAIITRVQKGTEDINKKAFVEGWNSAASL